MNANMKRLLIFALVPVTVWGIGSTYTAIKADRISKNTETQITMNDTVRFSSGTASRVPYLDANKDLVTSSVTDTELGYLSGVTSAIQTQLGTKTDTGTENEITLTGTAIRLADDVIFPGTGAVTLPVGTTEQQPTPSAGMIRYNSDEASFEGYTTEWGALGGGGAGGAGGSRLQLLDDPSFESGVANGTCTGCTASQETSILLATTASGLNAASLKMAFSAGSGDYTWTETTGAQYSNTAGTVSAWIKTSASDCHFVEMVDGAESQTVAISNSDEWKQYIINGTMGTTSYGYRVECNTSITDDVYVDETFAGAAEPDTFDIGTANFYGSVKWEATSGCLWATGNTSYANFSADVDCDDNARLVKGNYNTTNGDAGNSNGQTPQIKFSYIPAGVLRCEAKSFYYTSATGLVGHLAFSDGTSRTSSNHVYSNVSSIGVGSQVIGEFHYITPQTSETTIQLQQRISSGTMNISVNAFEQNLEISCYHYPSPQKVVAAKCEGLECENEFSVEFGGASDDSNCTSSPCTVRSEGVNWLTSATRSATGTYPLTFETGVFSAKPNCVCSGAEIGVTGQVHCSVVVASTTSATVYTGQSSTAKDTEVQVQCSRGSDYNQFDQRFVPVVQDEVGDNWTDFTPTGLWTTNTTYTGKWRRVGDTMQVSVNASLAGAPDAGNVYVNLPSGYTIDTAKLADTTVGIGFLGSGSAHDSGTGSQTIEVRYKDTSSAYVTPRSGSGYVGQTVPFTWASGDDLNVYFEVPISGWAKDKKAFIGNLTPKEFVQTPGSTKPAMYSFEFGGSSDGSNCTVSPCTIRSNFGSLATTVTRSATGAYPITFDSGKFSQTANCTCSAAEIGVTGQLHCSVVLSSATSGTIYTGQSSTAKDAEVNVVCHGVQ
jgi:hypothetical protein